MKRRTVNSISHLNKADNSYATSKEDIQLEAINFLEKLLKAEGGLDRWAPQLKRVLTKEAQQNPLSPFTEDEIWNIIKSSNP